MLNLHVKNETDRLRTVILGTAVSNGPTPTEWEAYDPKSLEHIQKGTYPKEQDMVNEMLAFEKVLKKYDVGVIRPEIMRDCNQIFTRDIGFVIENKLIKGNILPDRADEWEAIEYVLDEINPNDILIPPEDAHIEGGDVILWNDYIFIGTYKGNDYSSINTARTNQAGVDFIKKSFPHKIIQDFDLFKSMTNARENALHLDCCFQPIGKDKAIIYKDGFVESEDYYYLVEIFGEKNLFHITAEEMYAMYSNVFSISPEVIVSERNFHRLNTWLRAQGFFVEEIPYHEIGKQEGLLRCSTFPLIRE
ncbi:dimethylarginine dimethylaminohydrolase family protein [Sphingobacterium hungaricum]|uniref:arginine deiminase n=1 Tax=Sphingobacterium hungaricum TaxID=2082723 RepID=A0A928YPJ9_9SPHI|nr:arginine deiminase family protein [Sphingobacterium hungaricum]MBE8712994.1 amidinotransferase [Sphingobacterium hungaricum]